MFHTKEISHSSHVYLNINEHTYQNIDELYTMDYDDTFSIERDNDTSLPCLQPIFAPLSTSTPLPVSDHLETPRRATVLDDDFLMIPLIDLHPDALYTTVVKRRPLAHRQKMKNLRERKEIKMAIPCTPIDMYDQTLYSACSESQDGEQQMRYKRKIENQHLEVPSFSPPPRPDVDYFDRNTRLPPARRRKPMLPSPLPAPFCRENSLSPVRKHETRL